MGVKAAFFDVGDTLTEHWAPPEELRPTIRRHLVEAFGERQWFDRLIDADIEPRDAERQETNRWYEDWFAAQGIASDIEIDKLRSTFAVPLDLVSTPVPGAAEAVRWCKAEGLSVVLVTNTLSRGDAEVLRDWQRLGLADAIDGIVSSHDVGWRKPHPAMFERALELAAVGPTEAFMVGDNPVADIRGAQALGIRAVFRRTDGYQLPPEIRPDAIIERMTELPDAVRAWLSP